MPIKRYQDTAPSFPELGQLRKGAPKESNRPGKNLTYFRFTSSDPEAVDVFTSAYGDEPRLINCFLPFAYTDENWDEWQEEYVAGGLVHRCDGDMMVLWQKEDGSYSTDPRPCPFMHGEKAPTKAHPGCKPVGRLKIIIPELRRLAYVTALTTSEHDVRNLGKQLRALEAMYGSLRRIPLQLRRSKKKISTPGSDGTRVRRDEWLLSIEAAPSWVDWQLATQQGSVVHELPAPATPALPDGAIIVNGKTGEVLSGGCDANCAETCGPDWDDVPDQDEGVADEPEGDEGDFDPPPDFLLAVIPKGKHQGKTLGELLTEDPNYVQWISTSAQDEDIKLCAQAALAWHKETQPELW